MAAEMRPRLRAARPLAVADRLLRHVGAFADAARPFGASRVVLGRLGREVVPPLPTAGQQLGATLGAL